jgi:hypothetical protein
MYYTTLLWSAWGNWTHVHKETNAMSRYKMEIHIKEHKEWMIRELDFCLCVYFVVERSHTHNRIKPYRTSRSKIGKGKRGRP